MAIISGGHIIEGVVGDALPWAGAPSAGTNEVQTLTIGGTPTGGTFKLKFQGFTTGAITWSATNSTLLTNINAALDALPNSGTGGWVATAGTLTAGIGTVLITAAANMAHKLWTVMTVPDNSLTGTAPTLAVVQTTPGVDATYRGIAKGGLISDTTNGKLYINTGTPFSPTFTVVGAQT